MKNIKIIASLALLLFVGIGCSKSEDGATSITTPVSQNLNANLSVSNDNSGNVTITPTGEGAVSYEVVYGDGSGSDASAVVMPGDNTTHSYAEGDYTVSIIASNLAGEKTTATYPLNVTYRAPENLKVNPAVDGYNVMVSAEAQYANSFKVYYGDMDGETGTSFGLGETAPAHTYAKSGTYDVRVVALSGGAATSETTIPVTIFDPFGLPITFDNPNVNYFFGTFDDIGQQQFSTVENPNKAELNTSENVGLFTNGHASYSGTYSPLNSPIDFSKGKVITLLVYTDDPANIGKKLNVGLEKPVGSSEAQPYGAILKEPITKAGEWELLTFDFSTNANIPDDAKFNQLVFRFNDTSEGANEKIYIDDITLKN